MAAAGVVTCLQLIDHAAHAVTPCRRRLVEKCSSMQIPNTVLIRELDGVTKAFAAAHRVCRSVRVMSCSRFHRTIHPFLPRRMLFLSYDVFLRGVCLYLFEGCVHISNWCTRMGSLIDEH